VVAGFAFNDPPQRAEAFGATGTMLERKFRHKDSLPGLLPRYRTSRQQFSKKFSLDHSGPVIFVMEKVGLDWSNKSSRGQAVFRPEIILDHARQEASRRPPARNLVS
jgi:hypothetical protein